jgi:hypothetical protein
MCVGVQQFGALSLRTDRPFLAAPNAILGFYLRGGGDSKALGDLECQVERNEWWYGYSVSRSVTLREILAAQEKEEGTAPGTLLAAAAAGRWIPVRLRLGTLASAPPMVDRITLGSCLQDMAPCDAAADDVRLCLDHVVVAVPAAAAV